MKSQTKRIRDCLEAFPDDITTAQIHARTGTSRLNSRCSEIRKQLRKEGRDLICDHIPGMGKGPEAYRWRIIITFAPPTATAQAARKGHPGATSAVRHQGEVRTAQNGAMLSQEPDTAITQDRLFALPVGAYDR